MIHTPEEANPLEGRPESARGKLNPLDAADALAASGARPDEIHNQGFTFPTDTVRNLGAPIVGSSVEEWDTHYSKLEDGELASRKDKPVVPPEQTVTLSYLMDVAGLLDGGFIDRNPRSMADPEVPRQPGPSPLENDPYIPRWDEPADEPGIVIPFPRKPQD